MTDAVDKVTRSVGIVLLGRFDPADLSRLLGFCGRWIGGDFDADPTDVVMSDLRQMLRAAERAVDLGVAAPAS